MPITCRNRHCPKCQAAAATDWLAAREADLLPVGDFHVAFTLPAEIAPIAYRNKAVVYDLQFRTAAETLLTIVRLPQAPRRAHRRHCRASQLGLDNDPPPARPYDRAGWRDIARRDALGALQARLPPAGAVLSVFGGFRTIRGRPLVLRPASETLRESSHPHGYPKLRWIDASHTWSHVLCWVP
jgi:hypothetical protein